MLQALGGQTALIAVDPIDQLVRTYLPYPAPSRTTAGIGHTFDVAIARVLAN